MEQNSQLGLGIFKTYFWLVVWNKFVFSHSVGNTHQYSSQLTFIFFRGVGIPPSSYFHLQVGIPKGNRRNVHGQHGLRAAHSVLNSEGPDRSRSLRPRMHGMHGMHGLEWRIYDDIWQVLQLQWKSSSISTTSIDLADQGSNAMRSEDSKDFQELQKEYEAGYGVRALRGI